jgi:hypothetical protein
MDGSNQRQHLGIGQSLAIRPTPTLPSAITADADIKYIAHFYERIAQALFGNPGVLQRRSLAKYTVAFFRISFSRLSRRFSTRNLDSSISSGVTTLPPAPLSLPYADAFTQLRKV